MKAFFCQEWEWLSTPGRLPKGDAEAFVNEAARSPLADKYGCGILDSVRGGVRAGNIVGVIQTEHASLEILPKINLETGQVRQRLIDMLRVVLDLQVDIRAPSQMSKTEGPLLEQLIAAFIGMVEKALRRGLPRRYIRHEEDLAMLRGRLDVSRQFSTLLTRPGVLACQYSSLSSDQPLNQIMHLALRILVRSTRSSLNRKRLSEILMRYDGISMLSTIHNPLLTSIKLDRLDDHWRPSLSFAQLIIQNLSQTTSGGSQRSFSLLFNMFDLFERYVAKLFSKALGPLGWTVDAQVNEAYCAVRIDKPGNLVRTKPDLKLVSPTQKTIIIDTKWKDYDLKTASSNDMYQMMAYSDLYASDPVILLYPSRGSLGRGSAIEVSGEYQFNSQCASTLLLANIDMTKSPNEIMDAIRKTAIGWY